jgi:uncharacterized protein involved in exopolysaccharide biosynthesis
MDREIRKYLKLIKRWWWLLVVSVVIPMAGSYYFAAQQPDLYLVKATLMVGTGLQNPNPDQWQLSLSNTLAYAYAELVKQSPVTGAVIERLGLEMTPDALAARIGTRIYSGAKLLEIQVTDSNPEAAALIANALADELVRRSPASGIHSQPTGRSSGQNWTDQRTHQGTEQFFGQPDLRRGDPGCSGANCCIRRGENRLSGSIRRFAQFL